MNLAAKLSDWQQHKLIDDRQRELILEHENQEKRQAVLYALYILSAFCIGSGLTAFITADWNIVPPVLKLGGVILLYIAAMSGIWLQRHKNKPLLSESLIIICALFAYALAELTETIYQFSANRGGEALLWSMLTLPLLFLSRYPLLIGIWLFEFVTSIYEVLYDFSWFSHIMNLLFDKNENLGMGIILFLMTAGYGVLTRFPFKALRTAWRWWTIFTFIFFMITADIFYTSQPQVGVLTWKAWIATLIFVTAVAFPFIKSKLWPGVYGVIIVWLYIFLSNVFPVTGRIASVIMTLSLLGVGGVYAYQQHRLRLLNFITALAALRILALCWQITDSLLGMGVGLTLFGLLLLGLIITGKKHLKLF